MEWKSLSNEYPKTLLVNECEGGGGEEGVRDVGERRSGMRYEG